MDLSPLFLLSMQTMQTTPTIFVPSQQRLHKLRYLQKLGCQKPCWDQARLSESSLVNKQVVRQGAEMYKDHISLRAGGAGAFQTMELAIGSIMKELFSSYSNTYKY